MTVNNNSNLINQICIASSLQGKDLDALKTRLGKLSKTELLAELTKTLAGNNYAGDMGLILERTTTIPALQPVQTQPKPNEAQIQQLKEAQCKEISLQLIDENMRDAFEIFNSQHLGAITEAYDNSKDADDALKSTNVFKVLNYQQAGFIQLIEAKNNNLTKREYYEENKQRIKDIILTRLNVLKTASGVSYIDSFRGNYSQEKMTEIINSYVERICSDASIEDLKKIQQQFVSYNQVEEAQALNNFVKSAKDYNENRKDTTFRPLGGEGKPMTIKDPDKGIIPSYWDSDEPISFEEVYKLERGSEYSQYKIEQYVQAKTEMETVIAAQNKKQQFVDFVKSLRDESLPLAEKQDKLLAGFAEFYALSEDGGLSQIQKLIDKSKMPITIVDGKLNLDAYPNNFAKTNAFNSLLKIAEQEKEKEFKAFLGDKSIEDYQLSFEAKANEALGNENGKMLADAMKNDNCTVIQRYTGNVSMAGMALTVVGGILCFTPAAPLGAGLITAGNTLAIGGMVTKTGLGVADYATKDVQTSEEAIQLGKDFIMDAGGFIIGMKAGQQGMKAFSKLIDKKLVATFGSQIAQGNKLQALKTVFTNPQYLKNFSKAAGAKISTDFLISYMGDLAMMGVLDTQDDWKSLLQANLTGILVGMSGDIKDVSGVKPKVRSNDTPVTEQGNLVQNNKLMLEGDIKSDELTDVAPFAERLIYSEQTQLDKKTIRILEEILNKRTNAQNFEEQDFVQIILDSTTDKNINLINRLLEDENTTLEQILMIIDAVKDKEYPLVPNFFSAALLGPIYYKANSNLKLNMANKLIENDIPKELIPAILTSLTKENVKLLDLMLEDPKFDKALIPQILHNSWTHDFIQRPSVSSSYVKNAIYLIKNDDFPNNCISDLQQVMSSDINFVKQMCEMKDFPKDEIAPIIRACHESRGRLYNFSLADYKFKLAKELVNDKKFPNECISSVLRAIEKNQSRLFENLYNDPNIPKDKIANILTLEYGLKKGNKLNFADKVDFLAQVAQIEEKTLLHLEKYGFDSKKTNKMINDISLEMGLQKSNIKVSLETQRKFLSTIISNNNFSVNAVIKSMDLDKISNGIPLKYSRESFINDIMKILHNVNDEEKTKILELFNIQIQNNSFEGIPTIPDIDNIKINNIDPSIVSAVRDKIIEFTLKNETTIKNPELKSLFNNIIQGFPEFTTIVGKKQHKTHDYSVDIHTLKVLQMSMKDPMFETLSDEGKTVLKFAILMHDFGKVANKVDKGHAETSAKYAIGILDKFKLPTRVKSQIIEQIYNHHWFEDYNKGNISDEMVNTYFRTPEALKIAQIIAKADVSSINDSFQFGVTSTRTHTDFDNYMAYKFMSLNQVNNKLLTKSNIIPDTKFRQTTNRKFPQEEVVIKGKKIKLSVLNLSENSSINNLYEYGFAPGITKDNARFIVHMNDRISGLKVFFALSQSPSTNSVQSLSLISPKNNRTFKNQKYGVITDVDEANISYAFNENISSGYHKSMKGFSKGLFGGFLAGNTRTFVRDNLLKELEQQGIKLNEQEYSIIAENLQSLQYTSQIKDIRIGDKQIPASILKSAVERARDTLFENKDIHSEIVALNPRVTALVAKVSSINECSPEFLEMAEQYNLPIILMGNN